jgi:hypothetical protein
MVVRRRSYDEEGFWLFERACTDDWIAVVRDRGSWRVRDFTHAR